MTILASPWKSGKTWVTYQAILDTVVGRPALGHFAVARPVPTILFQLEMNEPESCRRFRRLALGNNMEPADVRALAEQGLLTVYNKIPLNFNEDKSVHWFHAVVTESGTRLVVIDSLLAVFAGADLNDNSQVRWLFTRAFSPLTSQGVAVLLLHHQRKPPGRAWGGEPGGGSDQRAALLGAQAIGAAAGRVYSLETVKQSGDQHRAGSFQCRVLLTGSWTPEDTPEFVVEVEDTDNDGTLVRVVEATGSGSESNRSKAQRASDALIRLVKSNQRICRKKAIEEVMRELGCGKRTVTQGLSEAKQCEWIATVADVEGRYGEVDLIPGPSMVEAS